MDPAIQRVLIDAETIAAKLKQMVERIKHDPYP